MRDYYPTDFDLYMGRDRDPSLRQPDGHANGWDLYVNGCGWGANVTAVHRRTGRREVNFTSMSQAARWCAGQHQ